MNVPEVDALMQCDLTKVIEEMMSLVDFIDSYYENLTNNNLMRYWQDKDVTLKSVVLMDLLDWLCCLAFSDGFIAPEEVQFINTYLKQSFSENDIIDLCKFRINQDYYNHVPLSFVLLYENDLVMKSFGIEEDFNSVEALYILFRVIGVQFIHCDNDVAFKEYAVLKAYTEDLSKRICDFELIQKHLIVLEATNGEIGEEYSEIRYPFNKDAFNEYIKELNGIEDINDEISMTTSSSAINIDPWQFRETKINTSWDLKLITNEYYNFTGEFDNHFDDFKDIFTLKNRDRLEYTFLTPQQYRSILNKIKSTSDTILVKIINENNIDLNSLSTFEKILLFTESFVGDINYKRFGDKLGIYVFNKIQLDGRFDISIQIATLIHELAHHLLAEIFEQAAMILLNSDKTDAIEHYVDFSMRPLPSALLNEYCAHTVEGHFTPQEYHHYGSYEKILKEFDMETDRELIDECKKIGNTFSQDILTIIEPYIDYNLRREIKQQFKEDNPDLPVSQAVSFETDETLEISHVLTFINFILLTGFDEALKNPEILDDFKKHFELNKQIL